MRKESNTEKLKRSLSTEPPHFNSDLYVSFDKMIKHITKVITRGEQIHFLISDWYDIGIYGDRFEVVEKGERCAICRVWNKGVEISNITIPTDKMYRVDPMSAYVEVIEGIDYSAGEYYYEDFRVN